MIQGAWFTAWVNGKKNSGLVNFVHVQLTFFCTFLYSQCTTTKWNSLTRRFKEYVNPAFLSFSFFFPYSENDKRTTVLFRTMLTQTTSRKKLIEASDSRNHIKRKSSLLVGCWHP